MLSKCMLQGLEYVYDTNWGEQLSSVVNPVPIVMNLETEECTIVDLTDIGDISGEINIESK